jgi:hypothetical protein
MGLAVVTPGGVFPNTVPLAASTAVVGATHWESFRWVVVDGIHPPQYPSGARSTVAFAQRQDGSPVPVAFLGEGTPDSGLYWWSIVPEVPGAHHLWLQLTDDASGATVHLATTVFAVSPVLPIPHVVGIEQEFLWVVLEENGVPVHGLQADMIDQSNWTPAPPPLEAVVVPTARDGANLVRSTPQSAGVKRCVLEGLNVFYQVAPIEYEAFPAGPPLPPPVAPAAGSVAWTVAVPAGVLAWTEVP